MSSLEEAEANRILRAAIEEVMERMLHDEGKSGPAICGEFIICATFSAPEVDEEDHSAYWYFVGENQAHHHSVGLGYQFLDHMTS